MTLFTIAATFFQLSATADVVKKSGISLSKINRDLTIIIGSAVVGIGGGITLGILSACGVI